MAILRLSAEVVGRALPRSPALHIRRVLDLEDSLAEPGCQGTGSVVYKEAGRRQISALLAAYQGPFRFSLRINGLGSAHFGADLAWLSGLDYAWQALMLPKVDSASALREAVAAVAHLRFAEIVPIVETVRGIEQVDAITDAARELGIGALQFGHFDYFSDAGFAPLPTQLEERYWQTVQPMLEACHRRGLIYLDSPLAQTSDGEAARQVAAHLAARMGGAWGMAAITFRQAALWEGLVSAPIAAQPIAFAKAEPSDAWAQTLIDQFRARPCQSFSLNPASGRFIAPHEYQAALQALERHG